TNAAEYFRAVSRAARLAAAAAPGRVRAPKGSAGSALLFRPMSDHQPLTLKEKVRQLPDKPGVYLMKDRLGRIIYVGKARSLKKRGSSYFQRGRARTID